MSDREELREPSTGADAPSVDATRSPEEEKPGMRAEPFATPLDGRGAFVLPSASESWNTPRPKLSPLKVASIAFGFIRRRPLYLLAAIFVSQLIPSFWTLFAAFRVPADFQAIDAWYEGANDIPAFVEGLFAGITTSLIAAGIHIDRRVHLGVHSHDALGELRRWNGAEVAARALSATPRGIGTNYLASILIGLACVLLLIPGIWAASFLMLAVSVSVCEAGANGPFWERCQSLANGSKVRLFCGAALVLTAGFLVFFVAAMVVGMFATPELILTPEDELPALRGVAFTQAFGIPMLQTMLALYTCAAYQALLPEPVARVNAHEIAEEFR